MKLHTKAVHGGDRGKAPAAVPVTTPIVTASSYIYESTAQLDRVFAGEEEGFCYARYDNPTAHALEALLTELECGAGALATSSGMSALQIALQTAMVDRPRRVLAADALYGASIKLLMNVFEPSGVEVRFTDIYSPGALRQALEDTRPACVLMETISNPLLRVGDLPDIARRCREAGAALVVDSTFATPLLARPLEMGADFAVHSLTKYLAGHGDVLGGAVITTGAHYETLRTLARTCGPVLGPFECYLAMRGIKTFPLRMERQCANACRVASWLAAHPRVEKTHYPGDPLHPDAAVIRRLFPENLHGGMVSFAIRGAGREEVFRLMDAFRMIVRATSLGDVHTMALYPAMSSHRDLAPKQRQRLGIGDNLLRLSVGIEDAADIIADLDQALAAV